MSRVLTVYSFSAASSMVNQKVRGFRRITASLRDECLLAGFCMAQGDGVV
jgi:hypothetical protein